MKKIRYFTLFFVFVILHNSCSDRAPVLYDNFRNPPAEARPFVRWWWNGDCVEEDEIKRELDVLKNAGIGGVEINPIRMPVRADSLDVKSLTWLSPEWNRMVKIASERAKKNGMRTDLIVGSGWPFGGEFLKEGEMIQRVITLEKDLKGPSVFSSSPGELLNGVPQGSEDQKVQREQILFLTLVPENLDDLKECTDLTSLLAGHEKIKFNVPKGRYKLMIGIWQEGYRSVTYGAPGSDGPVLDHFNKAAVRKYLDRLSGTLEKEFGTELGDYLWSLFCDSIELGGANWTTDFSEQFHRLCGYSLEPYLPFVFYPPGRGYEDDIHFSDSMADRLKRVRYDYNKTLVTLFLERFTTTFKDWCNEHGALCRYQAYGYPWLVGISEGYSIPDIPESNNWLFSDPLPHGFLIWNKYASSSGHIAGRPIISSEAMTNTGGVFKASLEMIKQADDMNFITGINHSVLHGFNYSPPEAGFPGWVRYGTYFNEQNPWWPYFRHWSDYNARLSAVFQASKPCADIAILCPTADVWSQAGLWRPKFYTTPWYGYQLWKSFNHNGLNADYVNESMIQKAEFDNGEIRMGEMKYKMLVLADVESLLPATAEGIRKYAEAGGKIVFINRLPGRCPSLTNMEEEDKKVRNSIQEAMRSSRGSVVMVKEPAGNEELIPWTKELLGKMKVKPDISISNPDPDLYQIHYRSGDMDIFFFSNQNEDNGILFRAGFQNGKKIPWKWDPETGLREVYRYGTDPGNLEIKLGPLESLLLVFDKTHRRQPSVNSPTRPDFMILDSSWTLKCFPIDGAVFQLDLPHLVDLGMADNHLLNTFSGRIEYKTTFEFSGNPDAILDLGKVTDITEVVVNGENVGTRWYGEPTYPLKGILRKGTNTIEITLTTTLFNYCRTLKDNPAVSRWITTDKPESSGLKGPVRIVY